MKTVLNSLLRTAIVGVAACIAHGAPARPEASANVADAVADLRTIDGAQAVGATWRYRDAEISEVDHRAPGPDNKPSGAPIKTHDIAPKAGAAAFDDSSWEVIGADTLEQRRSTGRTAFGWYRLHFTVPEKIGSIDTRGSTLVFEIVADDYAEVWVDGTLSTTLGQSGGHLVKGWNAPNRVVVTENATPGARHAIAVFVANGPLSDPPANYIWIRSCTLDVYKPGRFSPPEFVETMITRADPALDAIIAPGAKIEKIGEGFVFTEGPVWSPAGHLLFSDPNANTIYRWQPPGDVSTYRTKSGYGGLDIGEYRQPGSNGLTFDREGRLTICEHGNRRVTRLEKNGTLTVLADRYNGKRLNSPNDLVYRSDGALYFTDPPFGLPKFADDPRREQPHFGVYCLKDGELRLVVPELMGPNGIALSPDEKHLYVGDWNVQHRAVTRYDVMPDGTLSGGKTFFDLTSQPGDQAIDGVKVDTRGNVYISGPGGVWIVSPEGRHLGTLAGPEPVHNMAFGDADGKTLYLAAHTGLYRVRLNVEGVRPMPK